MEFQCRLCGSIETPKKKDTYYHCVECGICFVDPEKFTEVIEEPEEDSVWEDYKLGVLSPDEGENEDE